jgi:hypothetical protein
MDPTDFTLQVTRLGRLLEDARALLELMDDAGEKRGGDFILDRQYVVSLVDRTVDRLGSLTFNAYVLCSTEDLFSRHDALRNQAADLQKRIVDANGEDQAGEPFEYVVLGEYLDWMTSGDGSVRDFVGRIIDLVFSHLGSDLSSDPLSRLPSLEIAGTRGRIHVLDLGGGLEESADASLSTGEVRCRPLRIVLLGASRDEPGSSRTWVASVSEDRLSLRGPRDDPRVFVEARLQGDSSLVLLYCRTADGEPPMDVPPGFRQESTSGGLVAWRQREHDGDVETSLSDLGRSIFG